MAGQLDNELAITAYYDCFVILWHLDQKLPCYISGVPLVFPGHFDISFQNKILSNLVVHRYNDLNLLLSHVGGILLIRALSLIGQ
eukprot:snap_masked-scaffold_34-processed-gene-0.37-mRNA-1 protein AED:1.00 eAED:1.00 QI:0/-1/0/0/-1/1/1/0/84